MGQAGINEPDDPCEISWKPYRRPFNRPLQASWGTWAVREGFLLRLRSRLGRKEAYGEIAPLPEFGSESHGEAENWLAGLNRQAPLPALEAALAESPPACAFALASALEMLRSPAQGTAKAKSAALLSLNEHASAEFELLAAKGFKTFKLKAGMDKPAREWDWFRQLLEAADPGHRFRLDPNRSWMSPEWAYWQRALQACPGKVEFIEEPFPPDVHDPQELLKVARESAIPFALDESLLEEKDALEKWIQLEWPGYWIIKPSLSGNPRSWKKLLQEMGPRVILSSAFETGIGMSHLISLAEAFNDKDHGLGTGKYFTDTHGARQSGPVLQALEASQQKLLWEGF